MKNKTVYLLGVILFLFASCNNKHILDEDFNSNKIGWVEEFTQAHRIEIKNGFYYIYSLDTSKDQTSSGPQNVSYLWDLPRKYEITSSFQSIKHQNSKRFGIILSSPSLEYKFSLSDSSRAALDEWDNNRNSEIELFGRTRSEKYDIEKSIEFKIKVDNNNFDFLINNELVEQGTFKTKSWKGIRVFTSSGSAIKIDYLRIDKTD